MDLLLSYDNDINMCDIVLNGNNFEETDNIETLVLTSLFTDKTREYSDADEIKGWWGNNDFGSNLWELIYLSQDKYAPYSQSICQNSLNWLVTDNICDSVEVETDYASGKLNISIIVTKKN